MMPDEAMRGRIHHVITASNTADKSESVCPSGDSQPESFPPIFTH